MTLRLSLLCTIALVAACGDGKDCPAEEKILAFTDGDGDGWGGAEVGRVCSLGSKESDRDGDCNDDDDSVHPGAEEVCNGVDEDCDAAYDDGLPGTRPFYQDADLDGFGNGEAAVVACLAPIGYTDDRSDCDDNTDAVSPGSEEVCNSGVDDDCDGAADDDDDSVLGDTKTVWYLDADLDGYGKIGAGQAFCRGPDGTVSNNLDCEDGVASANPDGSEVCNGVDDDCDGLLDEADDTIDTSDLIDAYADADADGAGDPDVVVQVCRYARGIGVENTMDCDDATAAVNPQEAEVLCDFLDNDCDPTTPDDADRDEDGYYNCVDDCDDLDEETHPGALEIPGDAQDSDCDALEDCHQDADADGARSIGVVAVADGRCENAPNVSPSLPIDCDDADANVTWSGMWVLDGDDDGFGSNVVSVEQCDDPGAPYLLLSDDPDCDDGDAVVFPGASDPCNDGIDADCDGDDDCATCAEWFMSDTALPSGVYEIVPDGVNARDVYCDMDTDGGGWTLVASTAGATLNDAGGPYHAELATMEPTTARPVVWNGLVDLGPTSDIRFACKLDRADPTLAVDLSFYNVTWYADITAGTDADSCFSEAGNPTPAPLRRDNVAGVFRPLGDAWDGGGLVGEDACEDNEDFTVDFDDRGMDGDEADGTDWGEDDGKQKCTAAASGDAWFIFVR